MAGSSASRASLARAPLSPCCSRGRLENLEVGKWLSILSAEEASSPRSPRCWRWRGEKAHVTLLAGGVALSGGGRVRVGGPQAAGPLLGRLPPATPSALAAASEIH